MLLISASAWSLLVQHATMVNNMIVYDAIMVAASHGSIILLLHYISI